MLTNKDGLCERSKPQSYPVVEGARAVSLMAGVNSKYPFLFLVISGADRDREAVRLFERVARSMSFASSTVF